MDLANSIIPKIEVEIPSTLELTEHMLPAIKDWKVGQRYLVKLEVETVDQRKGSMCDPNDDSEIRSSFRVLGAQSLELGQADNPPEDNKGAFIRAVTKVASEYME